jgi:hypothetical protein
MDYVLVFLWVPGLLSFYALFSHYSKVHLGSKAQMAQNLVQVVQERIAQNIVLPFETLSSPLCSVAAKLSNYGRKIPTASRQCDMV